MIWIHNTRGRPDAMLTFAVISFSVVTLNILLSTFGTIVFNGNTITFQALDGAIMAVYLGATFTAYVSRRWTDIRYIKNEIPDSELKPTPTPTIIPNAPFGDEEDTEEIKI